MGRRECIAVRLIFAASVVFAGAASKAQGADPSAPVKTTLCELGATPEKFANKVVEVRAVVQTGFQTSLLRDDTCSVFIWLSGIDSTKDTLQSVDVALRKDREYQKLLEYLDKKYKPKDGSICARCPLYKVTATVVGRFEHVRPGEPNPKGGRAPGRFGYLNSYDSQVGLQGVSNVAAETIYRSASEKVAMQQLVGAQDQAIEESRRKAAALYNLTKFVEWPPNTFKNNTDSITSCVLGDSPFGRSLDQELNGKPIDDRRFVVRHVSEIRQVRGCQILMFTASERKRWRSALAELTAGGLLTVGEADDFTSDGGVATLSVESGKVRIEINVEAAAKKGLRISSRLLGLRQVVKK
jgi:YfiR/HmsC-like